MTNRAANPREKAILALYRIEHDGAYVNAALKEILSDRALSRLDRSFVSMLVYGTVKYQRKLDYVLAQYSSVKLKKLSCFVRVILRMGIYQILEMDRVPDRAAVDESVKLAQRYAGRSRGFVNAILRNIVRGKDQLSYPDDRIERLSIRYSYPDELVRQWIGEYGETFCEDLLAAQNRNAPLTVRVNTQRTNITQLQRILEQERITADTLPIRDMLALPGADIAALKSYQEGLFTVQGTSSALCVQILDPKENMRVLDMCAAPGGKATYIAELMHGTGAVLAFDIHAHKLELVERNAARLGLSNISVQEHDAAYYMAELDSCADRVLVDAPCSGLGIIRKKPDIKWSFSVEKQQQLCRLQYQILSTAARYVRPGGELIYSTCSLGSLENLDIVHRFLQAQESFCGVDISAYLPATLKKETAKEGYISLYPNIDDMDGFFICKMRRRG